METTSTPFAGEMFAVLTRLRGAATGKPAAKNPDHHRQFALGLGGRCPNVEGEAILALTRIAEHHVVKMFLLHTARSEAGGLAHALPFGRGLRGLPAQRTDRRRGKRDAQKVPRLPVGAHLSLDLALIRLNHQRVARLSRQGERQCGDPHSCVLQNKPDEHRNLIYQMSCRTALRHTQALLHSEPDATMSLYLIVVSVAYLLGSIPFGFLLVWLVRKEDIRAKGSGNIGATNVLRSGAKGLGILTFVLDGSKGYAAVAVAEFLARNKDPATLHHLAILAGLFVILGHMFPVWLHFKGGKGVATAFGVFLALCPLAALSALGLWIVIVALTRYVSLASILAAVVLPFLTLWLSPGRYGYASGAVVFRLLLDRHREAPAEHRAPDAGHGARLWCIEENGSVSRIAIVGSGSWGTALALSLARRGDHSIALWSHSVAQWEPTFPGFLFLRRSPQ